MARKAEAFIKINVDGKDIKIAKKDLEELVKTKKKATKVNKELGGSVVETDRKYKSLAQATSNSTKGFAKQVQGLGGLVRIYATIAANVFALSAAFNVLRQSAQLDLLANASEQLGAIAGTNFNRIADDLKEVTQGALNFADALRVTQLGIAGGATGEQLTELTAIATKAAQALGRNVPESVNRLTQAVIKGEPELADEFGIIIRVEEAVRNYAEANDIAVNSITTFQKQQAVLNQALEQGAKKFGELEIETNPYDKLAASLFRVGKELLAIIEGPIGDFANFISENTSVVIGVLGLLVTQIVRLAIPSILDFGRNLEDVTTKAAINFRTLGAEAQTALNKLQNTKEVRLGRLTVARDAVVKGLRDSKAFDQKQLEKFFKGTKAGEAFANGLTGKPFFDQLNRTLRTRLGSNLQKALNDARVQGLDPNAVIAERSGVTLTKQQVSLLLSAEKAYMNIESSIKRVNAETGKAVTLQQRWAIAVNGVKARVATVAATIASGVNASLSEGLFRWEATLAASQAISASVFRTNVALQNTARIITLIGLAATKVITKFLTLIPGIAQVFLTLTLIKQGFDAISKSIGLTSEGLERSRQIIEEFKDAVDFTARATRSINNASNTIAENAIDLEKRYNAIANATAEIVNNLEKALEVQRGFEERTSFEEFFGLGTGIAVENLQGVEASIRQLLSTGQDIGPATRNLLDQLEERRTIRGGRSGRVNLGLENQEQAFQRLIKSGDITSQTLSAVRLEIEKGADSAKVYASRFTDINETFRSFSRELKQRRDSALQSSALEEDLKFAQNLQKQISQLRSEDVAKVFEDVDPAIAKRLGLSGIKETGQFFNNLASDAQLLNRFIIKTNQLVGETVAAKEAEKNAELALNVAKKQTSIGGVEELRNELMLREKLIQAQKRSIQATINELKERQKEGQNDKEAGLKIQELENRLALLNETAQVELSANAKNSALEQKRLGFVQKILQAETELVKQSLKDAAIITQTTGQVSREFRVKRQLAQLEIESLELKVKELEAQRLNATGALNILSINKQIETLQGRITQKTVDTAFLFGKQQEIIDQINEDLERRNRLEQANITAIDTQRQIFEDISNDENRSNDERFNALRIKQQLEFNTFKEREANLVKDITQLEKRLENERKLDDQISSEQTLTELAQRNADLAKLRADEKQRELNLLRETIELQKRTTDARFGGSEFNTTLGREILIRQQDFENTRQTDVDTAADLIIQPLTTGLNELTTALRDSSISIGDAFKQGAEALFNKVGDIIIRRLNEEVVAQFFNFVTEKFGLQLLAEQKQVAAQTKNTITTDNLITTNKRLIFAIQNLTRALSTSAGGGSEIFDFVKGLGKSALAGIGGGTGNLLPVSASTAGATAVTAQTGRATQFFRNFGKGGISNVPAIFGEAGPEAAVPLPDGRSIPVTLGGTAGATDVDVNVYVNVEGGTTRTEVSGPDPQRQGAQLGKLISAKVQEELLQQMRPGGILDKR